MENNYYDVYLDSALQLAESIVIKSDETARAINNALTIKYGKNIVDELYPDTWKYYLNLAGEYHITDEIIEVKSLDTLETIAFTKQNLEEHTATKKAYQYGSVLYKELVDRHPELRQLILGVLYPADLDTAIAARRGTILSWPPSLVEDYEYTFIQRMQKRIYDFFDRWDNPQFALSDNLYTTALYGNLFAYLPVMILLLRLEACKTNEVHSYHIRQYLASHGMLDGYLSYLTRSQALFLYRNIAYIERNSGKNAVFTWLVQHIMTERGLPLGAYEMRHDITKMPASLKPTPVFEKVPLNTAINYDLTSTYTPNQIYDKQALLARDNESYREDEFPKAMRKLEYSLSNRLGTKLLESSVVDYANSEHYTLPDTLFNHWIWLSHTDKYKTYINFNSPLNDDLIVMSVKDAFVFYLYATMRTYGLVPEKLPLVMCRRVARSPKPNLADLRQVTTWRVSPNWIQNAINRMPVIPNLISTEGFYDFCKTLQEQAMQQYWMVCQEPGLHAYSEKFAAVSRLWTNAWVQLGREGQTYAQWFAERNIAIDEYTQEDFRSVSQTILSRATGTDGANAITLKDVQDAMIRLMTQLSSYSVQFVANINTEAILDAPNATTRIDDTIGISEHSSAYESAIRAMDSGGIQSMQHCIDPGGDADDWSQSAWIHNTFSYKLPVRPQGFSKNVELTRTLQIGQRVSCDFVALPPNPRRVTQVLGIETYLSRSQEEQANFPDFWLLQQS